jgi:hypothetical protein
VVEKKRVRNARKREDAGEPRRDALLRPPRTRSVAAVSAGSVALGAGDPCGEVPWVNHLIHFVVCWLLLLWLVVAAAPIMAVSLALRVPSAGLPWRVD